MWFQMVGTSNQNRPCKWMNGLICVMVGEGVSHYALS